MFVLIKSSKEEAPIRKLYNYSYYSTSIKLPWNPRFGAPQLSLHNLITHVAPNIFLQIAACSHSPHHSTRTHRISKSGQRISMVTRIRPERSSTLWSCTSRWLSGVGLTRPPPNLPASALDRMSRSVVYNYHVPSSYTLKPLNKGIEGDRAIWEVRASSEVHLSKWLQLP